MDLTGRRRKTRRRTAHAEADTRLEGLLDRTLRRRRSWKLRLLGAVLTPILLLTAFAGYLDLRLNRVGALGDYAGRPAETPGANWLIVGSDSRSGLSREQRRLLHTGSDVGRRADSMLLLHVGDHGPTLISLPRDLYVPIPGHGSNKLNAAFASGGPRLLARTVELFAKVRIDHYVEIGLGGFVGMVDAVGGVRVCTGTALRDPKAGLDLAAGCHTLAGGQALAYVRARHAFKGGDLDRVKHQREFLAALMHRALSSAVLANPSRIVAFALRGADGLTVDSGDHLWNLVGFGSAMRDLTRGAGRTMTVPTTGEDTAPGIGAYLTWDAKRVAALFTAVRKDRPVPV